MKNLTKYILIIIILFVSSLINAQSDSVKVHKIRLKLENGKTIKGVVLEETEEVILVKTEDGLEEKIPQSSISERADYPLNEYEDLNEDRLFITPTGRNLKSGHVYFAVYELFFPYVGYGLTDYFSISGGVSLIPGIGQQIFFFSPKLTPVRAGDFSGSIGILIAGINLESLGTLIYGATTYGTKKFSVTFTLGTPIVERSSAEFPIFMLGAEFRLSNHSKLISEWIYPFFTDWGMLSFGIRVFSKNYAGEFGLYYPGSKYSVDDFPFIPWLSLIYNF